MKKKLIAVLSLVVLVAIAVICTFRISAEASCTITRKGKVVFQCVGDSGICSSSALGYDLTCSGKQVAKPVDSVSKESKKDIAP